MSRFWSAITRELRPYIPGKQPQIEGLLKLNTNEHPLPPSPQAMAALEAVEGDALRRYPDPQALDLRAAIAESEGLAIEQVFVGNGSDEVLAHIFQGAAPSAAGAGITRYFLRVLSGVGTAFRD